MSEQDRYVYAFGPFVLDAGERLLLKDGSPLPLPPKAFDTLVVLVRNNRRLVRKDDLLDAVWPGLTVEDGNVSLNVHLVRKALGDSAAEPCFIETVTRQGYRFIAPVKQLQQATKTPEGRHAPDEGESISVGSNTTAGGDAGDRGEAVKHTEESDPATRHRRDRGLHGDLHESLNETPAASKNGTAAEPRHRVPVIIVITVCLLLSAAALILSRLKPGRDRYPTVVHQGRQLQGEAPNRVIDLSETYGRVNMTIFNKKTRVVFADPHEFFQDSGVTSFDWPIKFEEFTELPADLRRLDGKELTPESRRVIETQPCPPEVCKR
jgi:DNA-binding winged helix-turn-helix (wHTH) protein